jgi:hypothetical protein
MVGHCTQPDVYPPTISTQYYIINTAISVSQDVIYAPLLSDHPTLMVSTPSSSVRLKLHQEVIRLGRFLTQKIQK